MVMLFPFSRQQVVMAASIESRQERNVVKLDSFGTGTSIAVREESFGTVSRNMKSSMSEKLELSEDS